MELFLLLLFAVPQSSADTHLRKHFYTAVRGIDFPEFTAVGQVDGEQFTYYDSEIQKMIPRTEWIKKIVSDEPDYWTRYTQFLRETQEDFKRNIDTLLKRFNETAGVHTVQMMYGCELNDDGTIRGYAQFGYDGEDFLSLDLNSATWTAANHKAQIIEHMLDFTPAKAEHMKIYLKGDCISRVKKYVSLGNESLEGKDPPEVQVFHQQRFSSPELVCHATGFFPEAVNMLWQKDGEEMEEDVEVRETLPNQDGSFQKRIILRVSPEDLQKNNYTCVIQHSSLKEDLRLELRVDGVPIGVIEGVVVGLLVLVLVVGGMVLWKKMNSGFKPVSSGSASEDGDSASDRSSNGGEEVRWSLSSGIS